MVCLHWQTSLFTEQHEGTCSVINPFTSLICLLWQTSPLTALREGTCLINPFTFLVCLHWQDSEMMSLGSSYVQSQENQQTRHFNSLVLCAWFGMNLPLESKWKLSLKAWESVLEKGSLKRRLVGWLGFEDHKVWRERRAEVESFDVWLDPAAKAWENMSAITLLRLM